MIVDIKEKTIYYCDSSGKLNRMILFQLCRNLAYEFLRRNGKTLDISRRQYVEYFKDLEFPLQKEGTSCGVYVCLMAKLMA